MLAGGCVRADPRAHPGALRRRPAPPPTLEDRL